MPAPTKTSAGPKTPQGRAIAARNATTHGLFARDVVLPALGEDPAAYEALLDQLCRELPPRNLLERHYLEQIATASWRLRRLHRWQAQVYEDPTIGEDQRLDKLDKTLRHENTLTRQIDRAVRLLRRDLTDLFQDRAEQVALHEHDTRAQYCKNEPHLAVRIQRRIWQQIHAGTDCDLGDARLDNTCPPPQATEEPATPGEPRICENEPPDDLDQDVSYIHHDGRPVYLDKQAWRNQILMRADNEIERADEHADYFRRCFLNSQQRRRAKKCQNEPPGVPPTLP